MRQKICLSTFLLFSVILSGQTTETIIDSLELLLKKTALPNITKVDALNELGYRYWIVNSGESITFGDEALELAEKLEYPEGIAKAKRVLGVAYWTLGKLKLALENLTEAEAVYESIGDMEGATNCLMNTGMVYADIGDYDKALDIYDRSIEKFTQLDLKRRIATTFTKIGFVLIKQNQLVEAKEYLTNALNMNSEDDYAYGMGETHNRLGELFLLEGELEQADYHLRKAVVFSEQVKDIDGLIVNLVQFGKLLRLRKDYEDSEEYLLKALEKAKSQQLRKYALTAYEELKLLKKEQGNLEESLAYYDAFVALKDSIYNTDKSKQIAALEFSNQLADKEKELMLLRERERTNTIIKWSFGLGMLSLGIIGFLLYRDKRQKSMRKREVYRKKQELLAAREELAKTALENAHLKQKELRQQLEFKNKELTSYTLNFVQKNDLLHQLQEKLASAKNAPLPSQAKILEEMRRDIKQHVHIDRDWEDFKRYFEDVHTDFLGNLKQKHPDLSPNDLKICSLTRLNLNTKETASILGISPESAKTARYRLRKKLNLTPEQELLDYFLQLEK